MPLSFGGNCTRSWNYHKFIDTNSSFSLELGRVAFNVALRLSVISFPDVAGGLVVDVEGGAVEAALPLPVQKAGSAVKTREVCQHRSKPRGFNRNSTTVARVRRTCCNVTDVAADKATTLVTHYL